jgi:lambda family phage tail tape measure protein
MSTALKELATTGTTDFRSFAVGMLTDMAEVIIQQLVVAQLADTIGRLINRGTKKSSGGGILGFMMDEIVPSIFSGLGPIKFAQGGVMTDHGPLALKTYARGGIANTPQLAMFGEGSMPEAYVPLPDGKRIPVAMQGAETATSNQITINVDASGTKAQGDSGISGALARDLARVVDDRLVHHRRPGGLLGP